MATCSYRNSARTAGPAAISAKEHSPPQPKPVVFQRAEADHEEIRFEASKAIDGDLKTGWAHGDELGKNHVAVFETRDDVGQSGGSIWTIAIVQQRGDLGENLGRFRISVTNSPRRRGYTDTLSKRILDLLAIKPEKRSTKESGELASFYRSIAPELQAVRDQLAAARKKLDTDKITTLVMQEIPKPRKTRLFIGGSFLNLGEEVQAGVPPVLNSLAAAKPGRPLDRLALAHWLVDPENPLTARVEINRLWARHFGTGIVSTLDDFGTKGERPTHPELLDWLATEFVRQHWDMKAMHRLMVTSAAYRQSSRVSPELAQRDPQNRLLARGPRIRLEAEMVRDQALAVAGLLSPKIGGPSVMPPQPEGIWPIGAQELNSDYWVPSKGEDRYRRGLYTFWKRTTPYPSFMSFDAPSREFCVVRRPQTNTPLQALTTLNDPVYVEAAQALARRMIKDGSAAPESRARRGFRLVLARPPKKEEIERLAALYLQERERFGRDAKAAQAMAGSAAKGMSADETAELAAWTVVANVLLNLDETLNMG